MADFKLADKKREKNEGGFANVEGDRGKETYAGITRINFPKFEGWAIIDRNKPLRNGQVINDPILKQLISDFYKKFFWDVLGGDDIEDQAIAERLYDFGVNAGYPRSIKQIQEVLGLVQTGKIDAKLIDAINNPTKYFV